MYPKVKVRAVDEDDQYQYSKDQLNNTFDSFTIRDSSLPVKGVKHSSVSAAKVPKSYVPRSITPPPFLPKPAKNSEMEVAGKNPRIRASSIPRPRAVVSSPDNDQILGSKHKMKLRPSPMKNNDLTKSRQSEGTSSQTSTTSKKLFKSGEEKVTNGGACIWTSTTPKKPSGSSRCKATNASDVKSQEGPCMSVRVPTIKISKGKPCFMIT